MKKIFVFISCFFTLIAPLHAQYIFNEDGEPQPFCLNAPYREIIKPESLVPAYVTKAYNNDSLLYAYNPKTAKHLAVGIVIDSTAYRFKDVATHFTLDHGNLWLYHLTSPTAQGIGIKLKQFELPKGAQISYFLLNGSDPWQDPPVSYPNPEEGEFNGYCHTFGNEIYIEYYEPFGISDCIDIEFKYIIYQFTNSIGVSLEKMYKKKDESESIPLKSSGLGGDFYSVYNCCNKLPCLEEYVDLSKPVLSIYLETVPIGGVQNVIKGTGFFINRNPDYLYPDQPYILTAGHLFIYGTTNSSYYYKELRVNYQDVVCDDPKPRKGNKVGNVSILQVGPSYNKDSNNPNSGYCEDEDYALLQSLKSVRALAKWNVAYAGWSTSHNYLNPGYAYIGHPNGDIKTVNIETERAWEPPNGCSFNIYNKTGVNEAGFSGSPVFYLGTDRVVGIVCAGELNGNFICGDGTQRTRCGHFSNIHTSISSYIDPNYAGYAETVLPTVEALPSHCSNCEKDGDESNIDCGGSCQPCGMADDYVISSNTDLNGKTSLNARFNISIDGGSSPIEFKSQELHLNAGENILLKNFSISNGATFYTSIDPTLTETEIQGCQPACVSVQNVFTPNGDGMTEFLTANFSFVTEYDLIIQKDNYNVIFISYNNPVYENGNMVIWDGEGTENNNVYFYRLTYTDCNGFSHEIRDFCTVYKSASIIEPTNKNELGIRNDNLLLYPNPATNILKVSFFMGDNENKYFLSVCNLEGKTLINKQVSGNYLEIDVSSLKRGSYFLRLKGSEKTIEKKFLKE